MKIIALWGKGSKGKTATINLLMGLITSGFTDLVSSKHPVIMPIDPQKDNCYIVTYKGRKIGVTPVGIPKRR